MKTEEFNTISPRLEGIDIAKGITIVLMVLGHTTIPRSLSNFIFAFHMPFFFLVSGFTTNWEKYTITSLIKHRARTLLLPFVIYSAIVIALMELTDLGSWQGLLRKGWEGYSLWFILVLFLSTLLVEMIRYIPKIVCQWFVVFALATTGVILSYFHLQLPWTISTVPFATVLIFIGSQTSRSLLNQLSTCWMFLFTFLLTCSVSYKWRLDMAWNNITPIVPLIIGALAGSLFILQLSRHIQKTSILSKIFVAIGRETYLLVAFSQITIMVLIKYTSLSAPIRYFLMVIALIVLKIMKDKLNRVLKFKLL